MPEFFKEAIKVFDTLWVCVQSNILNWIITGTITFVTVKLATKQYYSSTKRQVSKGIIDLGLRSLLDLENNQEIPSNAQAIFVKYGGRCWQLHDSTCKFGEKIRRTVEVVGGNENEVSKYKPINYGVLGVANLLGTPVVYDFKRHELYQYRKGRFCPIKVTSFESNQQFCEIKHTVMSLGSKDTERNLMIAVPLISNRTLVGGLTFDFEAGAKTKFKPFSTSRNTRKKKLRTGNRMCDPADMEANNNVLKSAIRTGRFLVNAYFKKKGDRFE